ncbi:hypothetical protein DUI87_11223 [Hirundo rustica rustica]|uniref:Uncharacterized protein n=1 Tax=Hirundo rustica rustica TaxID=333673 RepID=A0A3M0KFU7_HIRRU|nr:hypothetical protein DUI87_11223 [Hirundo rustica rustica]
MKGEHGAIESSSFDTVDIARGEEITETFGLATPDGPQKLSTGAETEHTAREFADDAKLAGEAAMPKSCAFLRKAEKRADRNLMKFNIGKYKVQNLGRNNPRQHYTLRPDQFEGSSAEKNFVT